MFPALVLDHRSYYQLCRVLNISLMFKDVSCNGSWVLLSIRQVTKYISSVQRCFLHCMVLDHVSYYQLGRLLNTSLVFKDVPASIGSPPLIHYQLGRLLNISLVFKDVPASIGSPPLIHYQLGRVLNISLVFKDVSCINWFLTIDSLSIRQGSKYISSVQRCSGINWFSTIDSLSTRQGSRYFSSVLRCTLQYFL